MYEEVDARIEGTFLIPTAWAEASSRNRLAAEPANTEIDSRADEQALLELWSSEHPEQAHRPSPALATHLADHRFALVSDAASRDWCAAGEPVDTLGEMLGAMRRHQRGSIT